MNAPSIGLTSRRKEARMRTLLRATLITADGHRSVRIRNLSLTGAEVLSDSSLPSKGDVILKKGQLFAAATIVWAKGLEAGLLFYSDLHLSDLTSS